MENDIFISQSDSVTVGGTIENRGHMSDQTTSSLFDDKLEMYATGSTLQRDFRVPNAHIRSKPSSKRDDSFRSQQERWEFENHLQAAKAAAKRLVEAAMDDDAMAKSNAAFEIVGALDVLWRLRRLRGDDWIDVLNHLQGVLRHENYERFTVAMVSALKNIVEMLQITNLTSADLSDAMEILLKAGFNPWRPISHSEGPQ